MPRYITVGAIVAALIGVLWQFYVRTFLFDVLGIRRAIQPIEDFPYSCERFYSPLLEGCEDLWLDDEGRRLYLGCAPVNHRMNWMPGLLKFNASGRIAKGSFISVLDIDDLEAHQLDSLRVLNRPDYVGTTGDGSMDSIGFAAEVQQGDVIKFFMINVSPSVEPSAEDAKLDGPMKRASVQIFRHKRGSSDITFEKLVEDETFISPNRVVATPDDGVLLTNDHSHSGGIRRDLEAITGGGNLVHCDISSEQCRQVYDSDFNFPNGLTKGTDGRYYVPNSMDTTIQVFEMQDDKSFKQVDTIQTGMPMDNLSVDKNGDIWAAGLPRFLEAIDSLDDPWNKVFYTTILRIKRTSSGYEVEKVLEDRDQKVVGGVTTVAHDVKSGRLFMSGLVTPFIMVCDPR